ncbi:MAG: nicotinate-nucleotide--dimethylbenzimidazole phosphoribosyltransferase [Streptomycetaceae bacterium]|nr:nicotinate-nucleotide--dimethylbenzimidazole phosphoribosyltransferase [Streptomycetaceae bacterium]
MTDIGSVPGKGLPGNTGAEAVRQPHADQPADVAAGQRAAASGWGAEPYEAPVSPVYTFLDQSEAAPTLGGAEDDDDLLLMPGPQGSWSDPQPVAAQPQPAPQATPVTGLPAEAPESSAPAAPSAPAPAVAATPSVPHADDQSVMAESAPAPAGASQLTETGTAAADVSVAEPQPAPAPEPAAAPAPAAEVTTEMGAHEAAGRDSGSIDLGEVRVPQPTPPAPPTPVAPATAGQVGSVRRPLNMGPLVPEQSGSVSVCSLADRGPTPVPVSPSNRPTAGLEYLDVPPAEDRASIPAQQTGDGTAAVAAAAVGNGGPVEPQAAAAPQPAQSAEESKGELEEEVAAEGLVASADGPAIPTQAGPPPLSGALPVPADDPGGLADLDRQPAIHQQQPVPPATEPTEPAPTPQEPAVNEGTADDTQSEQIPAEPPVNDTPEPVTPEPVVPEPVIPEPVVPESTAPAAESVQPTPEPPQPQPEKPTTQLEPASDRPELPQEAAQHPAQALPAETLAPADAATGYDPALRDAVHRVIRERRDIRNGFRQDPIPHDALIRVLEAAHTAPSVGHSQPWDFVVIRSVKTREKMHQLAMRQRDAYAKSLPKARAKQFRELKIEAILDTPVNIVVTADPTRGGRHTLGRYTQPQMAPYSSALAVENLWLAARAEGLGVGWVSFFDEREMVRELGLPEHLEVVAYLCIGYVDEFPEEPELMQAGWSKRRPLSWVVHEEEYGRRALPGEEPHDLLDETLREIRPLDAKALGEAWERQKRMTKPSGALGMLEIISAQLSGLSRQCPPPIPEPAAVAIFAGDHGVHAQGVTAWPQEVTAQMVANFLGGGAVCNAFAHQVGAEVCVVDVGVAAELPTMPGLLPRKVRHGTGDFTTGPAMAHEEVLRAIEVGIETARDLVAAGNKALLTGEMGIANTTASAALIAVYTGADPAEVTGRGTGINDEMHARKVDVVRCALTLHKPDPADPIGVLAAIGGLEHAAMVGFVLGAASLRTPVILDGVSAGAAALVARAIAPEAMAACIAGHRSAEPGHSAALTKLGLRPLIDLDLRLGEGTGALLALPLVQSAARAMHEVATFDAAGVTEKD